MIPSLFHRVLLLSFALLLIVAAPALAQDADIVETAIEADDFNTLVAAVDSAGLASTLQGDGPFTVFAPTDDAFAALPDGELDRLLEPANRGELSDVLNYHVVPGTAARAEDVVQIDEVETALGAVLGIAVDGETVTLRGRNEATVVQTDIEASNGVIHVIDAVLLPPEE